MKTLLLILAMNYPCKQLVDGCIKCYDKKTSTVMCPEVKRHTNVWLYSITCDGMGGCTFCYGWTRDGQYMNDVYCPSEIHVN